MNATLEARIEQMRKLPARALRAHYRELFGNESRSGNRQFLFRRVAWRLQALAEGDLPERARKRALEIASDADLRVQPTKAFLKGHVAPLRDSRLPEPGTILRRTFQGKRLEVKVLADGFEWDGKRYQSLSAIASKVSGSRWNGYSFFGIGRRAE